MFNSRQPVLITTLMLTLSTYSAAAKEPPPGYFGKTMEIRRTTNPPVVDGHLEDAIWSELEPRTDLYQGVPVEFGPAAYPTKVWVTYDQDNLYIAAHLYMSPEDIRARQLVQGRTYFFDDRFAVYLDTFRDRRNAYFFQTNPNGVRREGLKGNDYWIEDWSGIWQAAAQIVDDGWTLEMAIPFKTLSFDPARDTWGFNFVRSSMDKQQHDYWQTRAQLDTPAIFGDLAGLNGLEQGLGLDVVPGIVVRNTRDATGETKTDVQPSLDAFYKVTPFMTAALTINTDFSAAEVDDRQVNFSRFSLFLPEKRHFFLQDAAIFDFGGLTANGRPFFSRRIGLSDSGEPLDLRAGAKLTGRTAGGWNVGALAVRQERGDGDGDTELFVGRFMRNVLSESAIGAIVTAGDPHDDANRYLMGTDFVYNNSHLPGSQSVTARGWYQRTSGDDVGDENSAYGAFFGWPNDKYNGYLNLQQIGADFSPPLGFVNRANIRRAEAYSRYRTRLADSVFRALDHSLLVDVVSDIDRGLETRFVEFSPIELETVGADYFRLYVNDSHEVVNEAFMLPGDIEIGAGEYGFSRYGFSIDTGIHRVFNISAGYEVGDFFNGRNTVARATLEWRPSPHFSTSATQFRNVLDFPEGKATVDLYRLRMDIAFNAQWAWLTYAQYDSATRLLGINSRLRWSQRAGQDFYLVLNNDRFNDPMDRWQAEREEVILKLGYTLRF